MKHSSFSRRIIITVLVLGGVYMGISAIQWVLLPPKTFPTPYTVIINTGQTLFSISDELKSDGVIRNKRVFEMLVMSLGDEHHISEGEYYFAHPVSVVQLALRITGKQFGIDQKKVTFPEGFSNKEMASRLSGTFNSFDSAQFLSLSKDTEGYLFPDTYRFLPSANANIIISTMKSNFEKKIAPLQSDIVLSGRSMSDIIIMASIIEKEAHGNNDRALVSGILWNRIDANIPLQVDAPFIYLLGKQSSELTISDLQTSSLYNTYLHKGFPPTPINNPGIAAIQAAIHPTPSEYFFYLHDKDGMIHYAKTYTEHKNNIQKYLK